VQRTLKEEVSKNNEKKRGEEKGPTNSRASMMSPSWENNNCKVSQMIVGANWCVWGHRHNKLAYYGRRERQNTIGQS
jgi:hypothetical protein